MWFSYARFQDRSPVANSISSRVLPWEKQLTDGVKERGRSELETLDDLE